MAAQKERQAEFMDALEQCVLGLYIALLDHHVGDSEFKSALCSGLAVLGCREGGGWSGPSEFTPKLSAIVTTAKMMVVYKAKVDRDRALQEAQAVQGMTRQEAEEDEGIESCFGRVQGMVNRFMVLLDLRQGSRPTPMNAILRMRAYGRAIHKTTNAPGVIDWHEDTLLYEQAQFSMATLRAMIHGLVEEGWTQLRREVLFTEEASLPPIDWSRLVDNAAEDQAGWCFVQDPRNRPALGGVDGARWMMDRLVQEPGLARRLGLVVAGTRPAQWKSGWAAEYGEALAGSGRQCWCWCT